MAKLNILVIDFLTWHTSIKSYSLFCRCYGGKNYEQFNI